MSAPPEAEWDAFDAFAHNAILTAHGASLDSSGKQTTSSTKGKASTAASSMVELEVCKTMGDHEQENHGTHETEQGNDLRVWRHSQRGRWLRRNIRLGASVAAGSTFAFALFGLLFLNQTRNGWNPTAAQPMKADLQAPLHPHMPPSSPPPSPSSPLPSSPPSPPPSGPPIEPPPSPSEPPFEPPLTPPASPPSFPLRWITTRGRNCYSGHGATPLDQEGVGGVVQASLEACFASCVLTEGCEAVTTTQAGTFPLRCWRLGDVHPRECSMEAGFDFHEWAFATPSPPRTPRLPVVDELNARWNAGRPSNDLSDAGIIVHVFDGSGIGPGGVQSLPDVSRFWYRPDFWAHDRLSASLINKRHPVLFRCLGCPVDLVELGGAILSPSNEVRSVDLAPAPLACPLTMLTTLTRCSCLRRSIPVSIASIHRMAARLPTTLRADCPAAQACGAVLPTTHFWAMAAQVERAPTMSTICYT